MMAGIVIFSLSASWLIPVLLLLSALTAFFLHRHWLSFLLFFSSLGWIISLADRPALPPDDIFEKKAFWAADVTDSHLTSAAVRLTVTISSCDSVSISSFACSVLIPAVADRFRPGDRVLFRSRIVNPAYGGDLPDENSFNPTFSLDGIYSQAYVSPDDITVISSHNTFRRTALDLRDCLRDLIYRSSLCSGAAWFLSATLLGDDNALDPSLRQQFREIGIAHYLALSGFHVGIIALIASAAFFPLRIWSRFGRMRHIAVIAVIWLYAFVCGLSPSIVRAAVLISIFLLARIIQRQSSPYNSLCVAAVMILAFSPRQLFAPGFQLSFCAVLSILVFAPRFNPFPRRASLKYKLMEFITVPVAAMLGTCLITVVHFHRIPLLFLIPNVILAIMLPLLLSSAVILMFSVALGFQPDCLCRFIDFIYNSIINLCATMSSFEHTEITGFFLPPMTVVFGAVALFCLALALSLKRRIYVFLSCLSTALAIFFSLFKEGFPEAELFITRQPARTDIVIRDNNSALIVTTAPRRYHSDISARLSRLYSDYLARRGCSDSLIVTSDNFTLPSIHRRGSYIIFGNKILSLADAHTLLDSTVHINYLLVTRQSGTAPWTVVTAAQPDTVIISRDTPPLRASRLIDSCRTHSIPAIHLIDAPFHLTLQYQAN